MTEPTPARRAISRLLLAGAALVLPLTASISYAAAQDPVAPPAPPAAPAAPKIVKEQRIVIIDKQGGATIDDADATTRVVTRDGKTIVIKTEKALSEAEIDAKVAQALAALPDASGMPVPPEGAERRVIVKRIQADGAGHEMAIAGPDRARIAAACADGAKTSLIESEAPAADGTKQKIVMRFCSAGAAIGKAGDGLKAARERISKDANLSPAIRDDILKQLDAEIERLAKQG